MYGLTAKVKSSLAPIKVDGLEAANTKQIAAIDSGNFNLRTISESIVSLTNLQKSYAIVKASTDRTLSH
jgi:hypothetical protein